MTQAKERTAGFTATVNTLYPDLTTGQTSQDMNQHGFTMGQRNLKYYLAFLNRLFCHLMPDLRDIIRMISKYTVSKHRAIVSKYRAIG